MAKRRPTPKRPPWQPLERAATGDPARFTDHGLTPPTRTYRNDRYSVFVRDEPDGLIHISLHRHDRAAVRDWRHLQQIKNEVAGPERIAVEVFPPESSLVDAANEYHLWVLPPGIDFGFGERFVSTQEEGEAAHGRSRARQRSWQPGLTTGRPL